MLKTSSPGWCNARRQLQLGRMKLVVPLFMDLEKALQEKTDSQDKKPLTEFVCVLDS